jgi:hypothetical protein
MYVLGLVVVVRLTVVGLMWPVLGEVRVRGLIPIRLFPLCKVYVVIV